MSDLAAPSLAEQARIHAREAADRSGVDVGLLESSADLRAVADLFMAVWESSSQDAPVSSDLLRALAHSGNYVAGAHRDGQLVGASVGFLAAGAGEPPSLHSHISAVAPAWQGADIGSAIKSHQRAWALDRGIGEITWTFDPLVRRNGWFNLGKLGAVAVSYHLDFYGAMTGINAGDPSDRLLVSWRLDGSPPGSEHGTAANPSGVVVLAEGDDRRPVLTPAPVGSPRRLCQVPEDIVSIRSSDSSLARDWRLAARAALMPAFADGLVGNGMTRAGFYVLTPKDDR